MNKYICKYFLIFLFIFLLISCFKNNDEEIDIPEPTVLMQDIDVNNYQDINLSETAIKYNDLIINIGSNYYLIEDELGIPIHWWDVENKLIYVFYSNLGIRFQKESGIIEYIQVMDYTTYTISENGQFSYSIAKDYRIKETQSSTVKTQIKTGYDVNQVLDRLGKPDKTLAHNTVYIYYTDEGYKIRINFTKKKLQEFDISLPEDEMTIYGSM